MKRRYNGEAICYYREEGSKKVVESRLEIYFAAVVFGISQRA
jgi:hypothetical protein